MHHVDTMVLREGVGLVLDHLFVFSLDLLSDVAGPVHACHVASMEDA